MDFFQKNSFEQLRKKIKTLHTGVTCGFSQDVFLPEVYEMLMQTFPDPSTFTFVDKQDSGGGRKMFYVGPEYVITRQYGSAYHLRNLSPLWKELFKELSSKKFTEAFSEAIGTEVNTLCNFGFTFGKAGCKQEPHIDGAIRSNNDLPIKPPIATLMYFNELDDPVSATEVYDIDRKTILLKGDTMRNSWIFFKQHPNAWHGFPEVPQGHTRRLLSLTYAFLPKPVIPSFTFSSYVLSLCKKNFRI